MNRLFTMMEPWQKARTDVLWGVLLIGSFAYVYSETFLWLYERYTNPDSHYSHGFLIPLISGYLFWKTIKENPGIRESGLKIGFLLIVLALMIHIGSVWTHIYFTSGFSMWLFAIGATLYLMGPAFTRKMSFPLAFLIFMFPLPMGAIDAVSFPLKLMVSNLAASFLKVFGSTIFIEGNVVHLAKTTLTIDDPCSGIRSLISLMALGALLAHFMKTTAARKAGLFLVTIPIAIFTNVLRVCALILAAIWLGGEWAMPEHWFHTASGMGVFGISLILLFITMKWLE